MIPASEGHRLLRPSQHLLHHDELYDAWMDYRSKVARFGRGTTCCMNLAKPYRCLKETCLWNNTWITVPPHGSVPPWLCQEAMQQSHHLPPCSLYLCLRINFNLVPSGLLPHFMNLLNGEKCNSGIMESCVIKCNEKTLFLCKRLW